jgi:pilus assembly protein CpaE
LYIGGVTGIVSTETSVLLPTARVDLFLKDPSTLAAARAISQDWRFARVSINVYEGDVNYAISLYRGASSPNMLLVETDTTDESFIGQLGELSSHCDEGTSAVVIGPVNDVNLYRSLTSMGVSDYLVRPVPQATLTDLIASSLIEKLGASGSRLIAMVGAKGGVGVTSLAQILAFSIADTLSQKTFLVDAAGGWSSFGVGMGFEPLSSTAEAVRAASGKDMDSFRRMLFHPNDKLSVLATGAEGMLDTNVSPTSFESILNLALTSYPVVIVDLSGASPEIQKMVLPRAHETILVAMPTLSSLRAARSLMNEVQKMVGNTGPSIDLVVNMMGIAPGKEVNKSDIKLAMDIIPSAVLPFNPKLFIGTENDGKRIGDDKGSAPYASALLPLARRVIDGGGKNASGPSLLGSLDILGKLMPKK